MNPSQISNTPHATIRAEFARLRQNKKRHRDIAAELGISEGELIAAHCDSKDGALRAVRLRPEWPEIIKATETLGEVMALTRNDACVHEKLGVYKNASCENQVGLLVGEIDLRVFYMHWQHGFAVVDSSGDAKNSEQQSLQFFDAQGNAVHKIFIKPQSNAEAFAMLADEFLNDDQSTGISVTAKAAKPAEKPDSEIDLKGFRQDWRDLKDTHEFFGLLRRYGVTRTQGLRLGNAEFVEKLAPDVARRLIEGAAADQTSIMVFVGNPGMIQIHTGPVTNVMMMGPWVNVIDPRFNLHLRSDLIANAWLVRKPTVDGIVTSVEVFDKDGEAIAMFFGERKPGQPERDDWRALLAKVLAEDGIRLAA